MALKQETVIGGAPHPGTELQVMESAAGFYIGYPDTDGGPYSRESIYFQSQSAAVFVWSLFRDAGLDDDKLAVRASALDLLNEVFEK